MRDDKQDVSVWLRLARGFGSVLTARRTRSQTPRPTAFSIDARTAAPTAITGRTGRVRARAIPGRPTAGLAVLVRSTEVRILPREHFPGSYFAGSRFVYLALV